MKNYKTMKSKILLWSAAIFFTAPTFAQDDNLVPNPSFEQVEGKVRRLGGIESANDWNSPTGAKADLFISKMDGEDPGAPNNKYGKESAADGGNYAGFVAFSYNDKEPRSYLSVKLKEPLRKGLKYCVKFKISLAEASSYASNNIAVNLSKRQFNYDEPRTIIDEMHIKDIDNKIFNARFNWDQICGTFDAKGGEKFLTIGNFKSNGDTEYERLRKDPKIKVKSIYSAYYYVDMVSVQIVDNRSECECGEKQTMGADVIYSKNMIRLPGMSDVELVKNSTVFFAYGKDKIEPPAKRELDSLVVLMKNNPSYKLKIFGHEDELETEAAKNNGAMRGMSAKRNTKVFYYLKNNGIAESRIEQVDKTNSDPLDDADNKIAHAKNRRVEFELVK